MKHTIELEVKTEEQIRWELLLLLLNDDPVRLAKDALRQIPPGTARQLAAAKLLMDSTDEQELLVRRKTGGVSIESYRTFPDEEAVDSDA